MTFSIALYLVLVSYLTFNLTAQVSQNSQDKLKNIRRIFINKSVTQKKKIKKLAEEHAIPF